MESELRDPPSPPLAPALPPLLVVVGPTASGKTALALRVAERCGGEIVSADSVQVYRGFDIGAGKPTLAERARIPHHLIDVADPAEAMDASRWAALAQGAIGEIRARGRVPIVCGGTFLWVRALLFGLSEAPAADEAIRERHRALAEAEGRAAVHAALRRVDPAAAARLAPNDLNRVSRALEVFELTGTPQTEWHARHGFRVRRYDARLVGLRLTADELSARIAERARRMLEAGLVEEVTRLVAAGYASTRPMQSVGYRQVRDALAHASGGGTDGATRGALDEAALLDAIVRATRIFARRQRTWLRDQPVEWLSAEDAQRFEG